jgi:hypothetical protein
MSFKTVLRSLLATMLAAGMILDASAHQPESAKTFLHRLYAPYVAGDMSVAPTGKAAPTIFDRHLAALIRKDQSAARDEVGALDGDPICDCQDFEPLKSLSIDVRSLDVMRATATVRFVNGSRTTSLNYTLQRTRSGWRVADIGSEDMPSLVAYLEKATRAH